MLQHWVVLMHNVCGCPPITSGHHQACAPVCYVAQRGRMKFMTAAAELCRAACVIHLRLAKLAKDSCPRHQVLRIRAHHPPPPAHGPHSQTSTIPYHAIPCHTTPFLLPCGTLVQMTRSLVWRCMVPTKRQPCLFIAQKSQSRNLVCVGVWVCGVVLRGGLGLLRPGAALYTATGQLWLTVRHSRQL